MELLYVSKLFFLNFTTCKLGLYKFQINLILYYSKRLYFVIRLSHVLQTMNIINTQVNVKIAFQFNKHNTNIISKSKK